MEQTADLLVDIDETDTFCGLEFLNANDQIAKGDGGTLFFVNALIGGHARLDIA